MSLELRNVWAGGMTLGQQRAEAMTVHEIIKRQLSMSSRGAWAGLEGETGREARPQAADRGRAGESVTPAVSSPQVHTNLPDPDVAAQCVFAVNKRGLIFRFQCYFHLYTEKKFSKHFFNNFIFKTLRLYNEPARKPWNVLSPPFFQLS